MDMTNTTNGYENAPATKLLATNCCACGRPLVEAESIESGMGPDCRKKYMGRSEGSSPEARVEANQLVHKIALAVSSGAVGETLAGDASIARIRELGFHKLADKLTKVWVKIQIEETDGVIAVVTPYLDEAVAAAQRIPGRRWDGAAKRNTFPASSKPAVWAMLVRYYPGLAGIGPSGPFVVPARAA